ncbi:hypothetical protein DICPUDRAFT_26366 [Dictyostelium purpureum]|uniref:Uncharacterized protein n=1 Tax=Dictyostelium purpureum TaxID=5786 RepID=F0Z8H1_DICPU|nr:uncharacterized protein DICPUDRAFT_26366 [Dictyostelium purpureum]EGC39726.1 hypothetical protein DICPUDRAFT_26366 [Dictyostelium purpureum]|eukprot:XP_003283712.1 hypothetical protein DICPUDRAFT_26366 [Dictyostelium purpureum]
MLLLNCFVYSKDNIKNKNDVIFTNYNSTNNIIDNQDNIANDITQIKLEKQLKAIFPNITHHDIEMVRQVRQLNITKVVKALTRDDLGNIIIGIIAGVEKSINPSPTDCVDGLRKQITSTNEVIFDFFNLYGITIGEFVNFLKIVPSVVREDIQLYNTCSIDKVVKKLSSCLNVIIHQGFTTFLDNEKNVLLAHLLDLVPISRGIASSILLKNYQLLGVHLGEYLGILINAP